MSWIEIALKNFPPRCGGHKGEHPIHPPTPVTLVGSLRVCITPGWVLWYIPLIQEGGFGLSTRRDILLYMHLWVWKLQNVIILIVIFENCVCCLLFNSWRVPMSSNMFHLGIISSYSTLSPSPKAWSIQQRSIGAASRGWRRWWVIPCHVGGTSHINSRIWKSSCRLHGKVYMLQNPTPRWKGRCHQIV